LLETLVNGGDDSSGAVVVMSKLVVLDYYGAFDTFW
jgi:hypothetical protein